MFCLSCAGGNALARPAEGDFGSAAASASRRASDRAFDGVTSDASGDDSGDSRFPNPASVDATAEELILAVQAQSYVLADAVLTYRMDGRYYVPLLELAERLDFYADADLSRGYVTGYYLSEDKTYTLDLEARRYEAAGGSGVLPSAAVAFYDEADIYVDTDFLGTLWPMAMRVDLATLTLMLEPRETLPFLVRQEREKRRTRMAQQKGRQSFDPSLPYQPARYKMFSLPTLDIDAHMRWDGERRRADGLLAVTGVQDILGTAADYTVSVRQKDGAYADPETVRLRLTRQAFGDDTLWGGLRRVEAGDVHVDSRALIDYSRGGRGFTLSNAASGLPQEFDRITVTGTGLPGWDVELYRNDELLDFGVVSATGEYRFDDVALAVGNNIIRTVLYGPQGQKQEHVETYQIGGGMARSGETDFSMGVAEAQRNLLFTHESLRGQPHGLASHLYAAHGLTPALTAFGSFVQSPTEHGRKTYVTAGFLGTVLGGLGQAEAYKDLGGGQAVDMRFARQLKSWRLNLQQAFYDDFESRLAGYGARAKTYEGEARLSTAFPSFMGHIGLQFDTRHTTRKAGPAVTDIGFRQSLGINGLRLTHEWDADLFDGAYERLRGRAGATLTMRDWQWRTQFHYKVTPDPGASYMKTELRFRRDDGFTSAAHIHHDFERSRYGAGGQVGYDFGHFIGSLDTGWTRREGVDVLLRASTSLGPFGTGGRYVTSGERLTRLTPLEGRVFLDKDGDGIFGAGDEVLDSAALTVGRRRMAVVTDTDGTLTTRAPARNDYVTVALEESTLPDPYYRPVQPGYNVVLRPGHIVQLDFPVQETGAIDGTIRRASGRPVAGLVVRLVDTQGHVVMTTDTAYDGYYVFDYVVPGIYSLQADPAGAVRLLQKEIVLSREDPFLYGVDMVALDPDDTPRGRTLPAAGAGALAHAVHGGAPVAGRDAPRTDAPRIDTTSVDAGNIYEALSLSGAASGSESLSRETPLPDGGAAFADRWMAAGPQLSDPSRR